MLRIVVQGASGRTGSEVVKAIASDSGAILCGAVVEAGSELIGRVCLSEDENNGNAVSFVAEASLDDVDVVIDFSTPKASLRNAARCSQRGVPCLIATTGLNPEQLKEIEAGAEGHAVAVVPNTSLGIFVMRDLIKRAKDLFGKEFDIELIERHHRHKVDAPSGTALALLDALDARGEAVYDRSQKGVARSESEVGVSVIRGGSVSGEHTVLFLGSGEQLEITHRAESRELFARGALRLARGLAERSPGLTTVDELFSSL